MAEPQRGLLFAAYRIRRELAVALRAEVVAPLLINVLAYRVTFHGFDPLQDFVDFQEVIPIVLRVVFMGGFWATERILMETAKGKRLLASDP